MQPYVGKIVLYFDEDREPGKPAPAVISAVHSDDCVNITLLAGSCPGKEITSLGRLDRRYADVGDQTQYWNFNAADLAREEVSGGPISG